MYYCACRIIIIVDNLWNIMYLHMYYCECRMIIGEINIMYVPTYNSYKNKILPKIELSILIAPIAYWWIFNELMNIEFIGR